VKKKRGHQENAHGSELPTEKEPRRRMSEKKEIRGDRGGGEAAGGGTQPRELPTGSSGSKPEDGYARIEESGRWIAEMTGSRDTAHHGPNPGETNEA
jgi:hypothetical protein